MGRALGWPAWCYAMLAAAVPAFAVFGWRQRRLAAAGNYGHAFTVTAALQVVLLLTCAALSLILPRRIAADAYQPTI